MRITEVALGLEKIWQSRGQNASLMPWHMCALALIVGIWHADSLHWNHALHFDSISNTINALGLGVAGIFLAISWRCQTVWTSAPATRKALYGFITWLLMWLTFGLYLGTPASATIPPTDITCRAMGTVQAAPAPGDPAVQWIVHHWQCDGMEGSGQVKVRMRLNADEWVSRGQQLSVQGKFRHAAPKDTPGTFDASGWMKRHGNHLIFSRHGQVQDAQWVYEPMSFVNDPSPGIRIWVEKQRHLAFRRISEHSPMGILPALSMGVSKPLDEDTRSTFGRLGIAHVLSVSGLHFGIIAMAMIKLLRLVMGRFPWILRRFGSKRPATLLSIPILLLYIFFVGAPISAQRALLMTYLCVTGRLLARKPQTGRTMAFAAIVILITDPMAISDIGFQLSFSAILGLAWVMSHHDIPLRLWLGRRIRHPRRFRIIYGLASTLAITIGTSLSTAPFVIWHFGQLPLLGTFTNLIVIPYISFILLPLAMVAAVLSPWEFASICVARIGGFFETLLVTSMAWIDDHLPMACLEIAPHALIIIVSIGVALALLWRFRPTVPRLWVAGAACLLMVCLLIQNHVNPRFWRRSEDLRITFIAMGQADATLIEFPDGHTMLVDVGSEMGRDYDAGRHHAVPYLRWLGIRRIDTLVITHGDYDHWAGMLSLLKHLEVGEVWFNGRHEPETAYQIQLQETSAHGIPVIDVTQKPMQFRRGDVQITRLWPLNEDMSFFSRNDASIILRLEHGTFSALLMGDTGVIVEEEILSRIQALPTTILKAGHHGSRHSTGEPWLAATRPSHIVFSVGRQNLYKFPHVDTLRRLSETQARALRTDWHGTIRITSNGQKMRIETFH